VGELEGHIIEWFVSGVGLAVVSLIGFVWRISHKVNELEKRLQGQQELRMSDMIQIRKDIDYVVSKVDKNEDKMYSIVRNPNK